MAIPNTRNLFIFLEYNDEGLQNSQFHLASSLDEAFKAANYFPFSFDDFIYDAIFEGRDIDSITDAELEPLALQACRTLYQPGASRIDGDSNSLHQVLIVPNTIFNHDIIDVPTINGKEIK